MKPIGAMVVAVVAAIIVRAAVQAQGVVIAVGAGGDLQDAINRAQPGDTIALEAGATFVGNFVLPRKKALSSSRFEPRRRRVAGSNQRMRPTQAPLLAKLKSSNSTGRPADRPRRAPLAAAAARVPSECRRVHGHHPARRRLTRPERSLEVPHDLSWTAATFRRCPKVGQKRGIALNSASTTIVNSYISDIKAAGQDSQAVCGWNGPGPFVIENNYLEAAGENFMLGGSDPSIHNLVSSDVTFRRNHLSKRLDWRRSKWSVKNLFELKSARRVLVENNLLEYNWEAAQPGFAIVLTPRNSGGNSPWSTVEDIRFQSNVVRHVAAVFNILGEDNIRPSGPARRIQIVNNLFYDVDDDAWGGNGVFMQLGEDPADVRVVHNTILHTGNLVSAYGGTKAKPTPIVGFDFENNVARHNTYGVIGTSRAPGADSLATFFPGAVFTHNVLAGGNASRYPGGNLFPSVADFERQFVDFKDADFRLLPTSSWKGAASDGSDLGVSIDALGQALGNRSVVERPDRPRTGRGRGGGGGGSLHP